MRRRFILSILLGVLVLVLGVCACSDKECPSSQLREQETGPYIGAEKCGSCHQALYAKFVKSGHRQHIQRIINGAPPIYAWEEHIEHPVSLPPNGLAWDDVLLVVGGTNVYSVFVDLEGDLITGPEALWDGELGEWKEFYPVQTMQSNCGSCHLTGYGAGSDTVTSEIGELWVEDGVGCEACHGPGAVHAASGRALDIEVNRTEQFCQSCHDLSQGHSDPETAASGGHLGHIGVNCNVCHDPHASARYDRDRAIQLECADCHRPNSAVDRAGLGSH
jgi:hypothetical protein